MAVICIICEGAYPYVVGGVSSWVHDLITSNPEHKFKLLCIIPNQKFAVQKYKLPDNVIEIQNILLDPYLGFSMSQVIKNNLFPNDERKKSIAELFHFTTEDSNEKISQIEKVFNSNIGKPLEVVLGKDYWEVLIENYNKKYPNNNFNIYYWTYRNIILNLIQIGQAKIPTADIYHAVSTGYAGYLGALAVHRKMGKLLLTEHGIYPREREEEVLAAEWIDKDFKSIWIEYFYYLSKLTYQYCDLIIALFKYNSGIQIENGAPPEKSIVIPNGIDEKIYSSITRHKKEGFNIGSVLRVVPIKDVKMMIKGFKIASEKIPDAKLWLVGPYEEDKEYYEECAALVNDLELSDKVTFTGRVDVKEYYCFLDILLLTSISEGQPLSILEGLASGVPFIATDVGNCREILKGWTDIGEAGVIIPPTSYTDLGKELVKLYQNKTRLKEFSENGKMIVKNHYTKDFYINRYKEIYKKLGEQKWQE